MSKKPAKKNAAKKIDAKKQQEKDQLSDEDLDGAAGGAVDAFIGSATGGAGTLKTPGWDQNHNLRAR